MLRMRMGCFVGLLGLVWGCGKECAPIGCAGKNVRVALVDEHDAPAGARGEVRYSNHQTRSFDCGLAPEADINDINCVKDVLELDPVYGSNDTIDVVFKLRDGSWAEPYRAQLKVERQFVPSPGDEGCECSFSQGTAEPVIVPAEARLSKG
jgi:hypothetical protein